VGHVEDRWFRELRDGTKVPKSRHGSGKRWKARYTDPAGDEKSRSFGRKGDAERFLTKVSGDMLAGTYADPTAGKITLKAYAETWLAAQTFDTATRENTARRLTNHVYPALGSRRLDQLAATPSLIQAWLRGLKVAPSTSRALLSCLSSIFLAAIDDGKVSRNPCRARSVKPPAADQRKVVPLEADRVAALRDALPAHYRAMVDAGTRCGLRQGEIFGLSPDDIDFLRRTVHVVRQVKTINGRLVFALPKRGKTRDVPLPAAAAMAFSEHIRAYPPLAITLPWHEPGTRRHGKPCTVQLLFTTPRARTAVAAHWFNRPTWKTALAKAGIPQTRENGMHVLRHTYASVLLASGVDIRRLAACLGHEDPGFTLRVYGHLMEGGEDAVRRALDAADDAERDGPDTAQGKESGS
jgi:integrase